jgi:uncharacterized membrane protein YhaH (DUF805 family)
VSTKKDLTGLGGWLGILIAFAIFGGIFGASQAIGSIVTDRPFSAPFLYFSLQLLHCIALLAAAFMLCAQKPAAVDVTVFVFWLLVVSKIAQMLILSSNGSGAELAAQQIVGTVAFAIVVTLYLRRSIRVKNTYGRDPAVTP